MALIYLSSIALKLMRDNNIIRTTKRKMKISV